MAKESSKKGNTFTVPTYSDPFESVLINKEATNSFIEGAGIRFMQFMALPDPSYKVEENAPRDSFNQNDYYRFEDNSGVFLRENGYIYYPKKIITAIFMNNSKNLQYIPAGLYNSSEAMLSVNGLYEEDSESVKISEYDKLVPLELSKNFYTVSWEQFKFSVNNVTKLQYPVDSVEILIDSNRREYKAGTDFKIEDGMLKWSGGSTPGLDPKTGRGMICSIRYMYKPNWYVKSVAHDIRVMPKFLVDGAYEISNRGPLLTVVREAIFENKRNANELDSTSQEFDPDLGRKGYTNDDGDPTSRQSDGQTDAKVISGSTSLEDLVDGLTASGKAR